MSDAGDFHVEALLRKAEEAATGRPLDEAEAREVMEWAAQQRDLGDEDESEDLFPAWGGS